MTFSDKENRSFQSKEVIIGRLKIGGNQPILIQSMTTTQTMNLSATANQLISLANAGCDMVRVTTQNIKEAHQLARIKNDLLKRGYNLPLIADVHFNPKVAEVVAPFVEKVRINPGNYVDRNNFKVDYTEAAYQSELDKIEERLSSLLDICKTNNTAIRIGTNHGSLSNRILAKYGNTPRGMVESTIEFTEICRKQRFENLVLSIKSSNVRTMVASNKLLVERMIDNGYYYPIHLGVTEAGDGLDGRLKSASGIGNLLLNGIGDTIRVSLTEKPENEIPVAKKLVHLYGKKAGTPNINAQRIIIDNEVNASETLQMKQAFVVATAANEKADFVLEEQEGLIKNNTLVKIKTVPENQSSYLKGALNILKLDYQNLSKEELQIRSAAEFSYLNDLVQTQGICISHNNTSPEYNTQLSFGVLQAMGLRFSKAEFIACPSCGRTYFDIQSHLRKVKQETSHLTGLRIAVMGCVVNGPGEMADADYGYVGSGIGKVSLYKGSEMVCKNIDAQDAVTALISLIKENGDWKNKKK